MEGIEVRRYHEGLAEAVESFEQDRATRYLCLPPHPSRQRGADVLQPAVVALAAGGEVIAAGYLDAGGRAAITIDVRHANGPGPSLVLRALGEAARESGLHQVSTNIAGDGPDMLEEFRKAGLSVLSSLWTGSLGEVVLGLEGIDDDRQLTAAPCPTGNC